MKLPLPCLMLVTDRRACKGRSLVNLVAAAVAGGVDAVQLREKDLPSGELWELAHKLRTVTRKRAILLINDRLDVALAVGADGVHLPEDGLPEVAARKLGGPDLLIGRSVHSVERARQAAQGGADYLVVGPIFPTASHPGIAPAGPDLLTEIRQAVSVGAHGDAPLLLAIGGISRDNVAQVVAAGARGCAVISAILGAPDPRRAARELKGAMLAAWKGAGGTPSPASSRGEAG
ncbi:MAG TPA: thiamine phosphate synthase [Dehalococcoidia bacterium]|nr:thiamine phosphate synthase [Dehalococcoidia bacterium]